MCRSSPCIPDTNRGVDPGSVEGDRACVIVSKTRTFLIVDDTEDNRFLAGYALRKAFPGACIVEASTAEEALNIAPKLDLDGVLTDHHLGASDGAQLMHDLAAAGVRCPVVMVTASPDPAVHRRAREAGAAQVFSGTKTDFVGYFRDYFAHTESAKTT